MLFTVATLSPRLGRARYRMEAIMIRKAWLTVLILGMGPLALAGGLDEFESDGRYRYQGQSPDFTVDYPWQWQDSAEVRPPLVMQAAHRDQLPVLRVAVLDEPFWLPLAFATRAASTQLSALGRDIEVVSEDVVELDSGVRANVGEVTWTADVGIGVSVRSLYVHGFHDGHWVVVNLTTADLGRPVPEAMRAIAMSLAFPERPES